MGNMGIISQNEGPHTTTDQFHKCTAFQLEQASNNVLLWSVNSEFIWINLEPSDTIDWRHTSAGPLPNHVGLNNLHRWWGFCPQVTYLYAFIYQQLALYYEQTCCPGSTRWFVHLLRSIINRYTQQSVISTNAWEADEFCHFEDIRVMEMVLCLIK